eukprot:CAMPEP_0172528926 /NCGR_PEP_ID=MMETSP1067-20121228/3142_1 /TAXON_ID=265564 ORGANISM="Thalassiosira punctigera, Strain Tpunct2005C2" /NCGR_SAMPLE_ID=MMETSP1067 /ASSEMBLY_ACC=CAM_ASM_000444 /LENGTH=58 /DNA_ID=CAMNT_0013312905 /DNA_START=76 /DNA_END=248 /DNA_ORIENTATION=+
MVTLSKSNIKIALRLASILAMASAAEGQRSDAPKRRRATGPDERMSMPLEELELSMPL